MAGQPARGGGGVPLDALFGGQQQGMPKATDYWAQRGMASVEQKKKRQTFAQQQAAQAEAQRAAYQEAYIHQPERLTVAERQQRELELPVEKRRRVVSGVGVSQKHLMQTIEQRHHAAHDRKPPSKLAPLVGGAVMGSMMGLTIVTLHTLFAVKGPGKFRGFGARAAGMCTLFGTIFGVGGLLRTH